MYCSQDDHHTKISFLITEPTGIVAFLLYNELLVIAGHLELNLVDAF